MKYAAFLVSALALFGTHAKADILLNLIDLPAQTNTPYSLSFIAESARIRMLVSQVISSPLWRRRPISV